MKISTILALLNDNQITEKEANVMIQCVIITLA